MEGRDGQYRANYFCSDVQSAGFIVLRTPNKRSVQK